MSERIAETAKAKVNLALHVLGRRADGYHDIDSIVAFAGVADRLLVTPVAGASTPVTLTASGPFSTGVPTDESNLICRAHRFLSEHVVVPAVAVHLEKNLPVAAGIGGGSADAAAALRAFVRLSSATLPERTLHDIALALGADVPVCLRQSACRMEGVGEVLSPLGRLPSSAIVLVNPGTACETAGVFKALGLDKGQLHLGGLDPGQPSLWRNDLTDPARAVQPVINDVLQALAAQAALSPVRMSGSGATCFGLAQNLGEADAAAAAIAAAHPDWWVVAADLS